MDYTLSPNYDTDAGTGNRLHQDSAPATTYVSAKDVNSVIWSLMEIVKAAGLDGIQFDPSTPATYQRLLLALKAFASVMEHDWSGAYDDATTGLHIQDAQAEVNVMRAIEVAKRASILDFSSTDDVAAELQSVISAYASYIPEGGFRIGTGLSTDRGLRGASAKRSQLKPLSNDINAVTLADTSGEFQQLSDFSVLYAAVGTGKGIVLANNNNDVSLERINVQHANRAFSAEFIAFMQRYTRCRADFCTTGFYAQGTDNLGAGAGTTLIYDQCYVSNGSVTGWDLNNIRSVTMIQPAADMAGCTNVIKTVGVGQLNIVDHHFEGTPTADGAFIKYTSSGTLSQGIVVVGGCLENNNLSARTFFYADIQANDDHVRVTLMNVNARGLVGGANAKLAKLSGAAGSKITIIAVNCDFGALEDLFDTSAMAGTWSYRKVNREYACVAEGVTNVAGTGTIATGVQGLDNYGLHAQVRLDDASLPTVMAHVTQTYTGNDTFKVRFTKLSDGTEDLGTYPVQWTVFKRPLS